LTSDAHIQVQDPQFADAFPSPIPTLAPATPAPSATHK